MEQLNYRIPLVKDTNLTYSDKIALGFISYSELMDIAWNHIASLGGFEKFAEWGLF